MGGGEYFCIPIQFNSHNLLAINQSDYISNYTPIIFTFYKRHTVIHYISRYQIKNNNTFQVGMHLADYTLFTVLILTLKTSDSRS
jgi:hypothetical protein